LLTAATIGFVFAVGGVVVICDAACSCNFVIEHCAGALLHSG